MKEKKKNKISSNIKQTIVIFLITLALFYLLTTLSTLIKQPANVFLLQKGTLFLKDDTEGLIIREEQVVKGEDYENGMLQIKTEGKRVAKGEAIFRYYSDSESSIKQKIEEIETQIQVRIPENNEIPISDIALIESQMKTQIEDINNMHELQKIKELKTDINTNITKKIEIIAENASNSEIHDLIKEKESYENELTKNSEYINAPTSGIVSYRVDNLEDTLKTDDFSYLNKEVLDNIGAKVGQVIATSKDSGKIINNFQCYIAVNLDSYEAKSARIGDKVTLELSNTLEVDSEISYINVEKDDSRTIVFKINNNIEKLTSYRKISLSVIWSKYDGFKVPNTAILTENNKNYVIKNRTGYTSKVLVKVEKQNDKASIVNNYTTDELKEMGYTEKEIISMPNLELYDEIIMNATK